MTSRLTQYCVPAAKNVTPLAEKFSRPTKSQVSGVGRGQSAVYDGLGENAGTGRPWVRGVKTEGAGEAMPPR